MLVLVSTAIHYTRETENLPIIYSYRRRLSVQAWQVRPSIKRALTQDSGRDTVICPVISVSDLRRDFQTVNHCRMASKSDRLFILPRIAADPSASAGHDAERNRWQGKALLASENDQAARQHSLMSSLMVTTGVAGSSDLSMVCARITSVCALYCVRK